MTDDTDTGIAFYKAEKAYRKAAADLYRTAGVQDADVLTRTALELAARRYCDAANTYREATRNHMQGPRGRDP